MCAAEARPAFAPKEMHANANARCVTGAFLGILTLRIFIGATLSLYYDTPSVFFKR